MIRIAESQLEDPESLMATLVHELAHHLLLGGKRLTSDVADHELVTDLLPLYHGERTNCERSFHAQIDA